MFCETLCRSAPTASDNRLIALSLVVASWSRMTVGSSSAIIRSSSRGFLDRQQGPEERGEARHNHQSDAEGPLVLGEGGASTEHADDAAEAGECD